MPARPRLIIDYLVDRIAIRLLNRYLWLSMLAIVLAQSASAQSDSAQSTSIEDSTSLSPSVVLVLKLVSSTHVRPTTGIVVSDDGLVLVSADFVAEQGEIVVLDGGTNITSHGRSAIVLEHSESNGLVLLSVEGLERPAFKMSADGLGSDSSLHLSAFPPAEYIAKGAQPVWLPVKISGDVSNTSIAVSADTPLPYVSGSIIDDCGYLAGVSLTVGAQSLESGKVPVIIFDEELDQALVSMQIELERVSCGSETIPGEDVSAQVLEPMAAELPAESARTAPVNVTEPPSLWRSVPLWLPLLGIIILAALIWKAVMFFRISVQPTKPSPAGPRSIPLDEAKPLDMDALPRGCNAVLMIEGLLDSDTVFKRYCAVDSAQIAVVIGRGEVDISIEHPAISRIHARIEGNEDSMTLSDLGSNNGTFIRGIPCLSGEVMFIEAEDEIHLGDVQFSITIITKEAKLS